MTTMRNIPEQLRATRDSTQDTGHGDDLGSLSKESAIKTLGAQPSGHAVRVTWVQALKQSSLFAVLQGPLLPLEARLSGGSPLPCPF